MLNVSPIPAFNDNYFWLLSRDQSRDCVVVDPGDAEPVMATLREKELNLSSILLTHHHWDHTNGVNDLKAAFGAKVYGPHNPKIKGIDEHLQNGDTIRLSELDCEFKVIATPGHTLDHISYYGEGALFCGDTLFSGGCGRLFEGTPEMMLESLATLSHLPAETQVFCAHEYTLANLNFALTLEKNNGSLDRRFKEVTKLRDNNQITLPSTIALELATNPFLRCHSDEVKFAAENHSGRSLVQESEIFAEIRKMKDNF